MIKRVLILLLGVLPLMMSAQTSRSLLVGIQDYPKDSGWSSIHAHNDIAVVSSAIRQAGVNDIRVLKDSQATHSAIVSSLKRIGKDCRPGDRILVFFSSHGQWITDLDADEKSLNPKDKYDEAIVPYDAQIAYNWNGRGYKGQNHLTDDELNYLLNEIAKKIGDKGQLVVLFDACHSGGMDRDEDNPDPDLVCRGDFKSPFDIPSSSVVAKKYPSSSVNWISISACREYQNNIECSVDGVHYGRLAYAFSQVFKAGITPELLISGIENIYKSFPIPKKGGRQLIYWSCIPARYNNRPLFQ